MGGISSNPFDLVLALIKLAQGQIVRVPYLLKCLVDIDSHVKKRLQSRCDAERIFGCDHGSREKQPVIRILRL